MTTRDRSLNWLADSTRWWWLAGACSVRELLPSAAEQAKETRHPTLGGGWVSRDPPFPLSPLLYCPTRRRRGENRVGGWGGTDEREKQRGERPMSSQSYSLSVKLWMCCRDDYQP